MDSIPPFSEGGSLFPAAFPSSTSYSQTRSRGRGRPRYRHHRRRSPPAQAPRPGGGAQPLPGVPPAAPPRVRRAPGHTGSDTGKPTQAVSKAGKIKEIKENAGKRDGERGEGEAGGAGADAAPSPRPRARFTSGTAPRPPHLRNGSAGWGDPREPPGRAVGTQTFSGAVTPAALPCGRRLAGEKGGGRAGRARLLAAPCSALSACGAHPHGSAHGQHRLPAAAAATRAGPATQSAARRPTAANGSRGAAHVRAGAGPPARPPRSRRAQVPAGPPAARSGLGGAAERPGVGVRREESRPRCGGLCGGGGARVAAVNRRNRLVGTAAACPRCAGERSAVREANKAATSSN